MRNRQLPCFNTNPTSYEDILNVFLKGEVLTMRAICTRCGRAKTPLMAKLVANLVDSGALVKTRFDMPNGAFGYEYAVCDSLEYGIST